ncbi:MAG: hypothetical protein EBY16_08450 [Gammaproteobacteria bacterium]|nr:hypothetical protein [Gammaproteobacteria bacterium]
MPSHVSIFDVAQAYHLAEQAASSLAAKEQSEIVPDELRGPYFLYEKAVRLEEMLTDRKTVTVAITAKQAVLSTITSPGYLLALACEVVKTPELAEISPEVLVKPITAAEVTEVESIKAAQEQTLEAAGRAYTLALTAALSETPALAAIPPNIVKEALARAKGKLGLTVLANACKQANDVYSKAASSQEPQSDASFSYKP